MGLLQDRVAIVTGSTAGMGRAIAVTFAQEGARVAVLSRRPQAVAETQVALEAAGAEVLGFAADVGNLQKIRQVIDGTVQRWGRIDILVNNAAILPPPQRLAETSDETWDEVLRVNLTGVFRTCREVWPHMVAAGGGTIVNVISVIAFRGTAEMAAYGAAKGGVLSISRCLAKEGAPVGIRVNCIAPGYIDTPMNERLLTQLEDPEAWLADTIAKIPLARAGHSREVAQAALFLASDMSSFTTGSTIMVDGGLIE
jgi:NAD(P)-dependent dehydrogenase (short-subunit alcohol dehydrogenase family)